MNRPAILTTAAFPESGSP